MSFTPNYFTPLEFRVTISKLPNVEFFTQQTSIPNISTSPIMVPTRFNKTFRTGDEVEFSNLDLTFIVDEQMENYREIFNWIISSSFPESHEQFSSESLHSDISVLILNSKKNANINITYKNCFPISLSDIQLNTTDSDLVYPQVTATFQYDTFDIEMLTN